MKTTILNLVFGICLYLGCSSSSDNLQIEKSTDFEEDETTTTPKDTINILSLGDSYTIGESVCSSCSFPEQLKNKIENKNTNLEINLNVIASSGWTTTDLKTTIAVKNLDNNYNVTTLLIGVNNQFQSVPFEIFEKEFIELVNASAKYAKGNKNNVIVISIPDYAFTPFGNSHSSITQDIDTYNNFIENYCNENEITYVYITDITRKGLVNPQLVANDGLHPSALAYTQFVERILPEALDKINSN